VKPGRVGTKPRQGRQSILRPIAFADPVETITFEDVERRAAYAPVASVKVGFQRGAKTQPIQHLGGRFAGVVRVKPGRVGTKPRQGPRCPGG
jgi:hypothetical protein